MSDIPPIGKKQSAGQMAFFRKLIISVATKISINPIDKARICINRNGPTCSACIPNGVVSLSRV